jgi:transposase
MPFNIACANANLPFVIANPVHIKRFAGAIGQRAKTDKLDAQLIAHYSESTKPILTVFKNQIAKIETKIDTHQVKPSFS